MLARAANRYIQVNMPRPPSHRHVVRDLRNVLGKTQAQFAEMAGVKASAINRIENGSLKLSPSLAHKISGATGADVEELVKGPKGQLLSLFGHPYTKDTFQQWKQCNGVTGALQEATEILGPMAEEASIRGFTFWLGVLLKAACRHRRGAKKLGVEIALIQALSQIRRDFGLAGPIAELLNEIVPGAAWRPGSMPPRSTEEEIERLDKVLKVLGDPAVPDFAKEVLASSVLATRRRPDQSKRSSKKRPA